MFESVTPEANLWLTVLLMVWAALLSGGFIFGKTNIEKTQRLPTLAKLLSSFVLVVAGISWSLIVPNTERVALTLYKTSIDPEQPCSIEDTAFYVLMIAVGINFGFLGDIFMSRKKIVHGMAAFGIGHLAYLAAFIQFGMIVTLLSNLLIPLGAWVFWLIVGFIAWYITVYRGQKHTALHWVALAYCLLLSSTAGFATGLALQRAIFFPLAVGTALFLFSGLLITLQLFKEKSFYLIDDVIWLTYGPAQALIVYSVYAALLVVI